MKAKRTKQQFINCKLGMLQLNANLAVCLRFPLLLDMLPVKDDVGDSFAGMVAAGKKGDINKCRQGNAKNDIHTHTQLCHM